MRHLEGRDAEVAQAVRLLLLHIAHTRHQLLRHAIVTVDAHVSLTRSVDGYIVALTQRTERLDMVGMVMSHEYSHDRIKRKSGLLQSILDGAHRYAGINENTVVIGAQVEAVTATSACKTDKIQFHIVFLFYSLSAPALSLLRTDILQQSAKQNHV